LWRVVFGETMTSLPKSDPAIPVLPGSETETMPCWSCGDMRAAQFCRSCGKVQPPAPTDYFSFFGLPRRLDLDLAALEREMLALSRRLHPDLCARASSREQEWSLEQSSMLNDAYRTLRDPISRSEYLLRLEGLKPAQQSKQATEEARVTGSKKQSVPAELLEEIFELNQQLEAFRNRKPDAEGGRNELETARRSLQSKLEATTVELKACWRAWDALITREVAAEDVPREERRRLLNRMLEILNRRRYVNNLVEEISAVLNG
jgi:molecular chaperone HscB